MYSHDAELHQLANATFRNIRGVEGGDKHRFNMIKISEEIMGRIPVQPSYAREQIISACEFAQSKGV